MCKDFYIQCGSFQAHSRKLGLDVVDEFAFHGNILFVLCYDISEN